MSARAWLRFGLLLGVAACSAAPAPSPPRAPAVAPAPPVSPAIEVEVTGPTGAPLAGAFVSAWSHFDLETSDPAHDERSDARGRARLVVPPGRYAVTATAPSLAAAYSGVVEVPASGAAPHLALRLKPEGVAIRGRVFDDRGQPFADARVVAPALSENELEVYVTHTEKDGSFLLRLPATSDYFVAADAPPRRRVFAKADPSGASIDLHLGALPAPRPTDDAIAAWLKATATPLNAAAELDAASAAAFTKIAGDAKILAMGEASHGSSEFPRDRMRVFQALVREGFTIYAAEIGWPDALALDAWISTGRGDVNKAIAGLLTWKDQTTETLELVRWMRAYNADRKHTIKLHFVGFDVVTPHAVPLLLAHLKKIEPATVDEVARVLEPFVSVDADQTYAELKPEVRTKTRAAIDALVARLDARRAEYESRPDHGEWVEARQLARIFQQADRSFGDYSARDAFMAENVAWLVAQNPGRRVLLDAHNGHIAEENHSLLYMGRLLREKYGTDYRAIGFAFGEGSFRAVDRRPEIKNGGQREFTIGRPPADTFDAALALAGRPSFVVDLRSAPAPIAAWLRSPQRMHHVSGLFTGPEAVFETYAPLGAFDAVIYEDRITAIHPLVSPR